MSYDVMVLLRCSIYNFIMSLLIKKLVSFGQKQFVQGSSWELRAFQLITTFLINKALKQERNEQSRWIQSRGPRWRRKECRSSSVKTAAEADGTARNCARGRSE